MSTIIYPYLSPVVTSCIVHEVELTEVEDTKHSQPGTKLRIGVAAVGTTQKSTTQHMIQEKEDLTVLSAYLA